MLLNFIFLSLKFLLIKADFFCNRNEIKFKTWCYKLLDINLILNFDNCSLQNESCIKNQIDKLINLYTLDPVLSTGYEFTVLKSQRKFESTNIMNNLIEPNDIKNNISLKILFNIYANENHGYVNNQPFKIGNPNLLKHPDEYQDDNSTEKCLYVHQTQNFNEKFTFKYGNCNKKYSFICIKEPRRVDNFQDRCSSYTESSPGGKWIECDEVFKIITEKNLMSKSQKCCLYNLNWQVDFYTANKICSQFGSEVFTFKAKGYKSILNNYDLYVDENYNQTKFLNFWTSCKLIDYPNNHEPVCTRDKLDDKMEDYDFVYPNESGFIIYYLSYSFKNNPLSKSITSNLLTYNLTQVYNGLNQTTLMAEFVQNLTQNTFVLVRRKENYFSKLTTRLVDTDNMDFFSYEKNSHVFLSLPFLNKCFHFTTQMSQNYTQLVHFEYLNEVLNMMDIFEIECTQDLNSTKLVINSGSNCTNFKLKREKNSYSKSNWKTNIWNFLIENNSSLVFSNFSNIEKILDLNCYDTAVKINDLIQECQIFNDDSYCKFKCPLDCDFNSDKNQVLVWQIERFKYLIQSSICKSAYHSNIKTGTIYFSESNQFDNKDLMILNNGIETINWEHREKKHFYFNSKSINFKMSLKHFENSFVLVKAVHCVEKMNFINIKFLTYAKSDSIVLKYLIPFFDDFYQSPFVQETKNVGNYYETYLSVNISQKQLSFINNYYEINDIKFPINFINREQDHLRLNYPQVINNDDTIEFIKLANFTYLKNCFWYVYNLNTYIPCSSSLTINQNFHQSLIFYPRIERSHLKRFIRVLVSQEFKKCSHNGFLIDDKCICYPGFGGNNCEIICKEGYFGSNCEFECPNLDCFGYLICNKDPIGCSCASGFTGYNCDQKCSKNTWGPKCIFECDLCPNNECDRFNGSCFCNENSFGKYCEQCLGGFYGSNCTDLCEENCLKCDKENGTCIFWLTTTKTSTSTTNSTSTTSTITTTTITTTTSTTTSTTTKTTITTMTSSTYSKTETTLTLTTFTTTVYVSSASSNSSHFSSVFFNITRIDIQPKEVFQKISCDKLNIVSILSTCILTILFFFVFNNIVDFYKNKSRSDYEENFLFDFQFMTILPSSI